jgi:hypothetical protein
MLTRVDRLPSRRMRLLSCVIVALSVSGAPAQAADPDDSSAAKAAITERLVHWTGAFNAKDLSAVCALFAPDPSYTVDEIVDGSRDQLCANIGAALARPA